MIIKGVSEFSPEVLSRFFGEFNNIMIDAYREHEEANSKYYAKDEKTLILRILDFSDFAEGIRSN